jgi:hypothetical protein
LIETIPGGDLIWNMGMFGENGIFAFGFHHPSIALQSPDKIRWSKHLNMYIHQ